MTANLPPLSLAHVADAYRRYPGEALTLFTRVEARAPLAGGFTVQISLPPGLSVNNTRASASHGAALSDLLYVEGAAYVYWKVLRPVAVGECFEYVAETTLAPNEEDQSLESTALVSTPGEPKIRLQETLEVLVSAKGRYLQNLPSLYQSDELMGRFLMLFESFWAPVDRQINNLYDYFDPMLTPAEALPWLAQWVDLVLDEWLTEKQQRRLLSMAAAHYRRRGSRQGLTEILEVYTGATPKIIEHTARNFRLGPTALLGPNIALGTSNQPHAFTVILRLPQPTGSAEEVQRRRREQEKRLTALIEAEKPAHTVFTLRIEETA